MSVSGTRFHRLLCPLLTSAPLRKAASAARRIADGGLDGLYRREAAEVHARPDAAVLAGEANAGSGEVGVEGEGVVGPEGGGFGSGELRPGGEEEEGEEDERHGVFLRGGGRVPPVHNDPTRRADMRPMPAVTAPPR